MTPTVEFSPGQRGYTKVLKWTVRDAAGDVVARFVFRDDAERFARLSKPQEEKR